MLNDFGIVVCSLSFFFVALQRIRAAVDHISDQACKDIPSQICLKHDPAVLIKLVQTYPLRGDILREIAVPGLNAVTVLVADGCRKVGVIIYGKADMGNTGIRRGAVLRALRANRLPVLERLVRFALADSYAEEIGKLLKLGIDGLFCPGGNAGIIAAYVLSLYNRRIPEDISLVASERSMYSRYAIPPQTTITQDYAAQAKAVADLLDARRRGIAFPRHTVIPYRLIERDSVRENPPPPPEESFRVARA